MALHNIVVADGLPVVEGGVSITGVTIDMITNLREVYLSLSGLCEALDKCEGLDEDVSIKHEQSKALLKYLRASKTFGGSK